MPRSIAHLAVALALVLAVAGCDEGFAGASPTPFPTPFETPVLDPAFRARMTQAVPSLNAFWAQALPSIVPGMLYNPIPADHVRAYLPGEVPPLGDCRVTAAQGIGNAWFCGGRIAYDETWLYELQETAGAFGPLSVLAHEFGHYIQFLRDGKYDHSIQQELQADCYSGAWARYVVGLGDAGLADTWGAALALRRIADDRDRGLPAPQWFDPTAHGRSTERAQAFALGFLSETPAGCAELEQFQRLERVDLGGGVGLELMQGVEARRDASGSIAVLSYAGRGLPTTVEARFDPALASRPIDSFISEGLAAFLGPTHRIIDSQTGGYAGAPTLTVLYEQTAQLQDGPITLHGMLIIAISDAGGLVLDSWEQGTAPVNLEGWSRIRSVMFATQAGLVVPGGAQ
jgi:hypothetical protein